MADENSNDLGGKVGLDITDFKAKTAELNRQIKVIETGFDAAAAGMDDWSKSEEGLRANIDALNKITDLQRQKVALLTAQYEKVADEKGATSKAAQDLQIRINKETETLNKNTSELTRSTSALASIGDSSGDAAAKADQLAKSADGLNEKTSSLASKGLKVAAVGIAAIGAAAGAAIAGLAKMASNAADYAGAVDDASQRTGVASDEFQEYAYAAKLSGLETDQLEKAMQRQNKTFADATDGSKTAAAAYERLGINIKDVGNSGDAFDQVIKALADMTDETERNSIANDIFGKSYADLGPLLNSGSAGIEQLKQQAIELGAVMGQDAVQAGADFGDGIDRLKTTFTGLVNTIGAAALPMLNKLISFAQRAASAIIDIIHSVSAGNSLSASLGNAIAGFKNGDKQLTDTEKAGIADRIKALEGEKEARVAMLNAQLTAKKTTVKQSGALSAQELDDERDALNERKDLLNRQKDAAQDALDKELQAEKDKLEAYKETSEEAIDLRQDQLDASLDAIDKEVEAVKAAEKDKLAALDAEYVARLKLIDADAAARIEALNAQKDALEQQDAAAKAAEKQRQEQERIAELQSRVAAADSPEDRAAAEKDLNDYLHDLDVERQEAARQAAIDSLDDQIKSAQDEAKAKEDALKQEIDGRKDAVQTEADARLADLDAQKKTLQESFDDFKDTEQKKVKERQKAFDAYQKLYDKDKQALEDNLKAQTDAIDKQLKAIDKAKRAASGGGGGSVVEPVDADAIEDQIDQVSAQYDQMISDLQAQTDQSRGKLDGMFAGVLTAIKWIVDNAGTIEAAIAGIAAGFAVWNVASLVMGVVNAIKALRTAEEGLSIAQAALNLVMAANPIGLVIAVVAALVAAIVVLWNKNDAFREALISAWEAIQGAFSAVLDWVREHWPDLLLLLTNPIAGALKLLYELNPRFRAWVDGTWDTIVNTLKELPGKIGGFFNELPGKIGYAFGQVLGTFAEWGVDAATWIAGAVPGLIQSIIHFYAELPADVAEQLGYALARMRIWVSDGISFAESELPKLIRKIVSFFEALPGDMVDIGKDLIKGLWDGITGMGDWLKDKISDFAGGVVSGFKDAFDIHSPSRVMRDEVGEMIGAGLAAGMDRSAGIVADRAAALAAAARPDLSAVTGAGQAAAGVATGDLTINVPVYLDGKVIATVVAGPLADMTRSRGRGLGLA